MEDLIEKVHSDMYLILYFHTNITDYFAYFKAYFYITLSHIHILRFKDLNKIFNVEY